MRGLIRAVVVTLLVAGFVGASDAGRSDYRGQVVDGDRGTPVAGTLILIAFYSYPKVHSWEKPQKRRFVDSVQTMSDDKGQFSAVGSEAGWNGAELHIFKAGYGPWRYRGLDPSSPERHSPRLLETPGTIVELRPLRDREERRKFIDNGWTIEEGRALYFSGWSRFTPFSWEYLWDLPLERLSDFQEAINQERSVLGLPSRSINVKP